MMRLIAFCLSASILFFNELSAQSIALEEVKNEAGASMMQTFLVFGVGIVLFYFIVFRPENQRRKSLEKQREDLKVGDSVVAMGIVGKVSQIKEDSVILKMVDGNKIEMKKFAISELA